MSIPIVEEMIVHLMLNGREAVQWRCTPSDLEALAVGRLYIEGTIGHADQVHLDVDMADPRAVTVHARTDAVASVRHPATIRPAVPGHETFAELFRVLFTTTDARYEHGGVHAAAASDGVSIIKQVEDVGRHNTVDKLAGSLLLAGLDPQSFGLLLSSRVSGEIANKAVRAGFAWIASRSIPTTLAVHVASGAGVPIIGRAASRDAHVYA